MSVEDGEDCYQVTPIAGEEAYLVRHFPDRDTRRPCCRMKVRVTDADRARAIPDGDSRGHAAALLRAQRIIERHHALVDNKGTRA